MTRTRPPSRRHVACALGLLGLALAFPSSRADDNWPTRPITLIMGFPAGSGVDVVGRMIQEPVARLLGQPVVIDYKPGAAGNIASQFVANAKPDGYTLMFGTAATHGSNAALYKKLPFDVETSFVPVAPVLDVSNVLMVNPDLVPVKTVKEFVELVKASPGKFQFASTGNGTGTHMAFAEFNARMGLDMVHIPYKGGPDALTSVVRGDTCCVMSQVQTALPLYKAGKVRLLGVTTTKPVAALPEVPTIESSGVRGSQGFDSSIWFGVFAPQGTDAAIVQKINKAIAAAVQQPDVRARFEAMGNAIRVESPEQFRKTVRDNRAKWAEVVKAANIELN